MVRSWLRGVRVIASCTAASCEYTEKAMRAHIHNGLDALIELNTHFDT